MITFSTMTERVYPRPGLSRFEWAYYVEINNTQYRVDEALYNALTAEIAAKPLAPEPTQLELLQAEERGHDRARAEIRKVLGL